MRCFKPSIVNQLGCANLTVETGHFPWWPAIDIRRPCISSSQIPSTVPAFPSVRTTALPTSSPWACSSSLRIVDARIFAVGINGLTVERPVVYLRKCASRGRGRHKRVSVEPGAAEWKRERPQRGGHTEAVRGVCRGGRHGLITGQAVGRSIVLKDSKWLRRNRPQAKVIRSACCSRLFRPGAMRRGHLPPNRVPSGAPCDGAFGDA
jgi:hypothetical protein